ncbi:aldehyde ferredoxin oxidoreductase [Actinocatenispora thailandica]|uniref:Aldehyde ferredoxin oxidoreductase n=1 Tax=Actinocatenispora thailandica TaxID=227318 RepID=A0A7R7DMX4_9ACTN|nr:aldehyde ferredoxin oxidoreductase N-terminal domain-containing protein [Actinocatenispora thailandica]BCJ34511.1 aldehyde ferredoxin oxidoreductase [Actinocatenispora thailandica]
MDELDDAPATVLTDPRAPAHHGPGDATDRAPDHAPEQPPHEPASLAALRILADAVAAGHRDPFDPAVPLILAAGPLAGSGAPGTARVAAIGLSPLSDAVGETRAEGPFGAALRAAGAATLALTGRADRPSILLLRNGSAELRDASELAGTGTVAATDMLAARYGERAGIAVIGPAGRRRARAATILTDRYFPLPRLGFGAVLGDRNLVAIVCLGGPAPPVADPRALATVAARYRAEQPANPLTEWQHRPPGFGVWPYGAEPGYGARHNFTDTVATAGAGLAPGRFLDRYRAAAPCPDCPTDCLKVFAPPGGPPVALHQEAVAALGPNLGIDDADTVLAAAAACLDAGLDPVSVGGTLGCLYEAAHRGRLPAGWPDCGFGTDPAPFIAAAADGDDEFAAALRDGATRLAARLGVPDAAMAVRGVELPPFDPRIQPGLALAYAAAPTGPRYDTVEHDLDFDPALGAPHCWPQLRELGLTAPEPARRLDADRADRTAVLLALWSALDAYGICPYASTPTRPLSLALLADLIAAGTGHRLDTPALLDLGADRLRRQHRINDALGVTEPRRLPDRMHTEPVAAGVHAGAVLDPDRFAAALARLRAGLELS